MAIQHDNPYIPRKVRIRLAYDEWLSGLSEDDFLAELDRVRNRGIGNTAVDQPAPSEGAASEMRSTGGE